MFAFWCTTLLFKCLNFAFSSNKTCLNVFLSVSMKVFVFLSTTKLIDMFFKFVQKFVVKFGYGPPSKLLAFDLHKQPSILLISAVPHPFAGLPREYWNRVRGWATIVLISYGNMLTESHIFHTFRKTMFKLKILQIWYLLSFLRHPVTTLVTSFNNYPIYVTKLVSEQDH